MTTSLKLLGRIQDVIDAATCLTVIGYTPDDCPAKGYAGGQVIVGLHGWTELQIALEKLREETKA